MVPLHVEGSSRGSRRRESGTIGPGPALAPFLGEQRASLAGHARGSRAALPLAGGAAVRRDARAKALHRVRQHPLRAARRQPRARPRARHRSRARADRHHRQRGVAPAEPSHLLPIGVAAARRPCDDHARDVWREQPQRRPARRRDDRAEAGQPLHPRQGSGCVRAQDGDQRRRGRRGVAWRPARRRRRVARPCSVSRQAAVAGGTPEWAHGCSRSRYTPHRMCWSGLRRRGLPGMGSSVLHAVTTARRGSTPDGQRGHSTGTIVAGFWREPPGRPSIRRTSP